MVELGVDEPVAINKSAEFVPSTRTVSVPPSPSNTKLSCAGKIPKTVELRALVRRTVSVASGPGAENRTVKLSFYA